MNNSFVVLAVIVSLATMVMLGINLYMMMQVKKERKKNFILKRNISVLSIAIHKKLEHQKTATILASSQTEAEDWKGFLNSVERDLNQIDKPD